ncbi:MULTISPECIES: hypothetical protein [Nitratireductor]|uniref:hypothetical protein n=1 Tax=Nitratireductor TaxID=245876 RepID=UPI000D0D69D3|nr:MULTISPECIES: hypothetical protein [Nitratireductor]PSM18140.1 hypothetical protein C7T96_09680 [Nitratireductor sp. StC3]
MTATKPWYMSRTVWASLITVLTGTAGLLGVPVGALDNAALTETVLETVTAISGLFALFGRLSATAKIG